MLGTFKTVLVLDTADLLLLLMCEVAFNIPDAAERPTEFVKEELSSCCNLEILWEYDFFVYV